MDVEDIEKVTNGVIGSAEDDVAAVFFHFLDKELEGV